MADDPSVADDDLLYRRLHPRWIVGGDNPKISSAAFQNAPGVNKLSANLGSLLDEHTQSWEDLLRGMPGYGMATLTVGCVREFDQGVVKAPEPDDPSHVHVEGDKKKKAVQRGLARAATNSVLQWPDTPE